MKKKIFIMLFLISFLTSCLTTGKLKDVFVTKEDNCQTLKVVASPFYPPFSLVNEAEYLGFGIETTRHLLQNAGLSAEFIKTKNWNESVDMIMNGQADLIVGAYYNSEVDFLKYIKPHIAKDNAMIWFKKGFINRLETADISKLNDGNELYLGFSSKSKCQNLADQIANEIEAIKETNLLNDLIFKSIAIDKLHNIGKSYKNQFDEKKMEDVEKKSILEPINILSF